jgi:hypothetical protein
MKKIILICITACFFTACNRDLEFATISVTPPALTVEVEGAMVGNTYPKIEGATVQLYNSGDTLLVSKTTNVSGQVVFTKAELKKEGIFTAKCTKDALSGSGTTSYMLLNDGNTLLIVDVN